MPELKDSLDCIAIDPIVRAEGTVTLPGSKSISNRALLLAALSQGKTELTGLLRAEDTDRMLDALRSLGIEVRESGTSVTVYGVGSFPVKRADLFVGNAGTVARMLTAALAFAGGDYTLDGVSRMRERPIGDLVDALRSLGAKIEYRMKEGYLPIAIKPAKLSGNFVRVRGNVSSQFLTALLVCAPVWLAARSREDASNTAFHIAIEGPLISRPYVRMTAEMMRTFGAHLREEGEGYVVVAPGYKVTNSYAVEGDASAASYFLALGALAKGPVRVNGVGRNSLQGDVQFAEALRLMGADVSYEENAIAVSHKREKPLCGLKLDCTAIPDAAMTFVPMALSTSSEIELHGIASWRVKETDRLDAMVREVSKFGAQVDFGNDWIRVKRGEEIRPARVATYLDHRMAMSFALAACAGVRVEIENPACTAKTFPNFFDTFFSLLQPKSNTLGRQG